MNPVTEALLKSWTLEPWILQKADEIKGLKDSHDLLLKNHNSLQEQKIVLELGSQLYQKEI